VNPIRTRRGHPLLALLGVLGGWGAIRAMLWEDLPSAQSAGSPARSETTSPVFHVAMRPVEGFRKEADPGGAGLFRANTAPLMRAGSTQSSHLTVTQTLPLAGETAGPVIAGRANAPSPWFPVVELALQEPSMLQPSALQRREARRSALSGSAWVLMRPGGGVTLGAPRAVYGASQAGAVVRFRLFETCSLEPSGYVRAYAALNGTQEKDVAVGLSVRLPKVPVLASAEVRVTGNRLSTFVRPSIFVHTVLPPFQLPFHLEGEAYGQAGYVGGRGETAFADGQVRVNRVVEQGEAIEMLAGIGAWSGAQQGASRIDLGPTLTLGLRRRGSPVVRLGVDWRFRIAGNAAPESGPALTLSAGF